MENQALYLVKVEANANNNKYYKMIPMGNSFEVQYGRIGNANYQSKRYPMYRWDSTLRSKLKKGYVDQTRLVSEPTAKIKNPYLSIDNPSISKIVERLQLMANNAINENYTISSSKVTQKMIDEAQCLLNRLIDIDQEDEFNQVLLDLFRTIPRKMKKVQQCLANNNSEFGYILDREQDLLDVMKGQVVTNNISETSENAEEVKNQTILEAFGLEFYEVDDKDIEIIKKEFGYHKDKYIQAWKVVNKKTQNKFDEFVKNNKIKKKKLLWHGTRSENVWSIINMGLVLRPNAVITGKMFGYGIYFSPDFDKSRGYTSVSGSRWSRGYDNTGFMMLMDVAYGNPFDVYDFNSKYYNLNYENLQNMCKNSHCLHAHNSNGMLRKDEIVVYKQEQCTIKYLIEIK